MADKERKKGIYGERHPESLYGDYYLTRRGPLSGKDRFAIRILNTAFGWWAITWLMKVYPEFFIHRLEQAVKPYSSMDVDVSLKDSKELKGFEDLIPLYRPINVSRRSLQLDFDEAQYLFALARSLKGCSILEIGRYRGGSTLLFATATDSASKITSVDNMSKAGCDDKALQSVIDRFGFSNKVALIVADSRSVKAEPESYDLIFIDGDHTYEGVKKDYEHWKRAVKKDGHLFFHDAAYGRRFATVLDGPAQCVTDIDRDDHKQLKKVKEVGSLVHYFRTDAPW